MSIETPMRAATGPTFFAGGEGQNFEGTDIRHANGDMCTTKNVTNVYFPVNSATPGLARANRGTGSRADNTASRLHRVKLGTVQTGWKKGIQRFIRSLSGCSDEGDCKLVSCLEVFWDQGGTDRGNLRIV